MTPLKHLHEMDNIERYTFWQTNLVEAQKAWLTVNPDNVDLCDWRDPHGIEREHLVKNYASAPTCGTLCCFGGWLPWFPHFRELGVRPDAKHGVPMIGEGARSEHGGNVAKYLFGARELFNAAETSETVAHGDDYSIVAARIRKRLADVSTILDELIAEAAE